MNLGAGQLSGRKSDPVDGNKRALARGESGRAIAVVKSGGDEEPGWGYNAVDAE